MTHHDDTELLTLTEVCERLGVDYAFLRPYAELQAFRDCAGAKPKKGSKGVGFPPESLSLFAHLIEQVKANRITLKTLPAHLATLEITTAIAPLTQTGYRSNGQAIAPLTQSPLDRLIQAIETLSQSSKQPDELLTLKAAQARTGVPLRVLRQLPRVFGKVSLQDIQARIAEEKQNQQRKLEP